MDKPKTTPKDFFLYISGFATLYVSAISLIDLFFEIINKLFPDNLSNYYYYDAYSTGLRLALASLIIVFPLYLVIASYLDRFLRNHPERRDLGVRKWLTFLTLFLTGAAVAVDLIVLINKFLGGEITTRFVLKVIAVLIVAGAVFAYYLYDLRKSYAADMPKRSGLLVTIASVLVLASLVWGFVVIGSPMKARAMKFDDRRVNDLTSIQWQIINYWQQKGRVPQNLSDLNDPISGFSLPVDPETGKQYGYERSAQDLSFKLCADFNLKSENPTRGGRVAYPSAVVPGNENWLHDAGTVCFDRTIDRELYPVRDAQAVKKGY